jgi:hypothetical protein
MFLENKVSEQKKCPFSTKYKESKKCTKDRFGVNCIEATWCIDRGVKENHAFFPTI